MASCKRVPKIVINIVKENAAKSTVISPLAGSSSPQDSRLGFVSHSSSEGTSAVSPVKTEAEDEEQAAVKMRSTVRMGVDSAFANLQKSLNEQVDQFRHSTEEKIGKLETSDRQLRKEISALKDQLKQGDRKKLELKEQIEFMEREISVERGAKISLHESLHQERIERAEERRQLNDNMVKMQDEVVSLKKTIEQQQLLFETEINERHRERNGFHEIIKRKTDEHERDKSAYVAGISKIYEEKRKLKEECDAAVAKNVWLTAQLEKETQRSRLNKGCDAEFGKFMATAMMRGARGDFLDGFNRGILENQQFGLAPDPIIPGLKLSSTIAMHSTASSSCSNNGTAETWKRRGAEVEDPTGTKRGRIERAA